MTFAFDLISDLHIETWGGQFDWTNRATSTVCVVAGDIARDRALVIKALKHLGQCYQAVFYIDGNDEHTDYLEDLGESYNDLIKKINRIPNVVYLQDNVVVVEGVAILGTNGWWGFDFDLGIDISGSSEWYQEKFKLSDSAVRNVARLANTDSVYMSSSIKRLQTHKDVKKIVVVTHTVPDPALVDHDIGLEGHLRKNTMGNRYMMQALALDTEHKIDTWCFGHFHGSVDQTRSGIRFVNNCRGRADTQYSQHVYHPKRIVIEF